MRATRDTGGTVSLVARAACPCAMAIVYPRGWMELAVCVLIEVIEGCVRTG